MIQILHANSEKIVGAVDFEENAQILGKIDEEPKVMLCSGENAQYLGKNIETAQILCNSDDIAQILTPQEIEIAQILGILYQKCTNFDTGEVVLSLGGGSIDQIRVFDPNFGQNQDKKLHKFWAQ